MSAIKPAGRHLPPTPPYAMSRVRELETLSRARLPQVELHTDHVIHAGLYARTIRIKAGVLLTGAEIKRATLLILSGHVAVTVGDSTQVIEGYHVMPASAGRKQAFLAMADTDLTMIFATDAGTVEDAETQFTDEPHLLMSRHADAANTVTITGE